MRILWITNLKVAQDSGSFRGGWMVGALNYLIKSNVSLAIAYPNGIEEFDKASNITYYSFSYDMASVKYNEKLCSHFISIFEQYAPDVIHIWGTEYIQSYAAIEAAKELQLDKKVIIYIQGMISIYAKHYSLGIPEKYQKCSTLVDFIRKTSVKQQTKMFWKRGKYEEETIKKASHLIGRTTWDRVCSMQINPAINYYYCNEILRKPFYSGKKWSIEHCERYSIFTSQANYPIKGIHFVLPALEIIKKQFPTVKLYIAGKNVYQKITNISFKDMHMLNTYERWIYKEIIKRNLKENIVFTGELSAEQMRDKYLEANVVICPSTIENSPNTISEAQILGVPVIGSYVGGVPDQIKHGIDGYLYSCDEPYMLAYYVTKIFSEIKTAQEMSQNAIKKACIEHDPDICGEVLLNIYRQVMENE